MGGMRGGSGRSEASALPPLTVVVMVRNDEGTGVGIKKNDTLKKIIPKEFDLKIIQS